MAATLCFAMLAAGLSAARCAAAVFPIHPTAVAAATKLPPKLPPKLPLNVVLAQVPWKRSSRHPVPEFVPLATLPWANCHVVPLYMPYRPEKTKQWVDPDYNFIMAMCRDKRGNLWLATEGSGIYRYDPSASKGKHWTQFTKQNTHGALANNCIYAIACDNHDRVWAGELNHGVSVFNGKQWQDYDIVQNPKHKVLAGPLGDHVYAMKFDRYTDQMWIGTNAGISVYQCNGPRVGAIKHRWRYITQANGLPMNPDAIAFGNGGIIYVGTQCGGLAVGTRRRGAPSNALGWSHYQWTVIKGPWHMPLSAIGKGLPGNLVNSVATTWANHLVVATDEGIALGRLSGGGGNPSLLNLTFEHGRNFVAKVYGLWHPPVHWTPPSGQLLEKLPTEDHTTVAAWQPNPGQGPKAGYLWLGHWRAGLDVWQYNSDGKIIQRWHIHEPQVGNYVESLQPLKGNAMAVGCYGKGVFIITLPGESENAWRVAPSVVGKNTTAPEPRGARPPGGRELTAMANAIRTQLINSKGQKQPRIVPLPDDWRTEGSWLGRYGKYYIDLCGMWPEGPRNAFGSQWGYGAATDPLEVTDYLSYNDCLRGWLARSYDGRRASLEMPYPFARLELGNHAGHGHPPRRQAEYDDHGEVYRTALQGPGLGLLLNIPRGALVLSIYEFNDDAHVGEGDPRRDYSIAFCTGKYGPFPPRDFRRFGSPRGVKARIINFAGGGVWKRFLVRGPADLVIHIKRNHSFNTIINAVALDWTTQKPPPYFRTLSAWRRRAAWRTALTALQAGIGGAGSIAGLPAPDPCGQLLSLAQLQRRAEPATWAISQAMVYATADRWLGANAPDVDRGAGAAALRATCDYRLCRFRQWEADLQRQGLPVPRKLEAMTKWKGRLRVFRDGGYHQLARNAARQRDSRSLAAK